jgi:N-acyl homoserine lactone hydrolase
MRYVLALLALLAAAAAGLAFMVGIGAPIGAIAVDALPSSPSQSRDWEAVFASPADLKVTAFVTGWVEAGPEILIDAANPRTPAAFRKKIWVPSVSYLVEHPTKGRVLLDTGLKAGDCAYGTEPLYWVPCRNSPGSDAVSQLAALGLKPSDLTYVVVSHFHGDHVSGLGDVIRGGAHRIVTSGAEIDGVRSALRILSGYESSMLKNDFEAVLVDRLFASMPIVGRAADLFGDGSLWLIPVPGHTAGQLAALINARRAPHLLTFDASHLKAGFENDVIPGAYVDRAAAEDSLAKLRALAAAYPQIKVIYGHEPSQWQGRPARVPLAP